MDDQTADDRAEMQALYVGVGPSWERRRVPVPTPAVGQVLIRARAVGLNRADVLALDRPPEQQGEPRIAGYEVTGPIIAVGDGVEPTLVGTRVMATTTQAFAEQVLADHRHALAVPDTLTDEEAAALPTALLTEHGALRIGRFKTGQSVLSTGATSAIGLVGIQIAKALGASTVIATTRSGSKIELLTSHGADVVVDTTNEALTERVREATAGRGVDLVLDHVGGQPFTDALAAIRKGGTLVQIGRLDQAETNIDLDTLAYRHLAIEGVSFGAPEELAELLATANTDLMPAVADGRIRPVIDRVVPFERADDAAQRVRDAASLGKVVMRLP
jgi:NADPH2:quinone reductase